MQLRVLCLFLLAGIAAVTSSSGALGQSDPASVERTIPKFEAKPSQQSTEVVTPVGPQQGNAQIGGTFILGAVNITGATVFSSDELAKSFEQYLAGPVGQAELNKIVADITERYRRAGYVLSYAVLPEQSVASGIVNIRVVEGFVSDVRIEGDAHVAPAAMSIAERLRNDRPLRTSSLERALALIRKLPGVAVKDATLSGWPNDPRRHVLTITLVSHRVAGLVYVDNRGTIEGARARAYSSVSAASVLIPGDEVHLDLFAIPSDRFRYWYGQLKDSVPLNADGTRFVASVSRGDQFQRISGQGQRGNSHQFAGEFIIAFAQSRSLELNGHFSVSDWLNEERRAGRLVQRDRLDVARAWLDFTHISKTRLDARFSVSQGLDLGSDTEQGDALATRPFGSAKFTKLNADVQMIAPISSRIYLRADTTAQISTRALLASEEFSLGGSRVGRAYDFNSVTGDSGVGVMAELNYRLPSAKLGLKDLTLFAYADGGAAFRKHPSPGLPGRQSLAGFGTGVRVTVFGVLWSGEIGVPVAPDHHVRAFFSAARVL